MNTFHPARYNDYSTHIRKLFGERVQKISVNAGFTCPNRDGTKGADGCIYCDNTAFSPYYCGEINGVSDQLREGIRFFGAKYEAQKYIAYFQTFTNTYAPVDVLEKLYREALSVPDVIGLVIATRPDAIDNDVLDLLETLSKEAYLVVELGMESTLDRSLNLIHRGHTWNQSVETTLRLHQRGIKTGAHLIMGLPGESLDDMLHHAEVLNSLPLYTLKLHQLQVLKDTPLEKFYLAQPDLFHKFTSETYADFIVRFLEHLSPTIIAERFLSESPLGSVLFPDFKGMKNFEFRNMLTNKLERMQTWQGKVLD